MGLDVEAYSKAEYLETMGNVEEWEDKYWMHENEPDGIKTEIARHWISEYADRARPIVENGVYKINGEQFSPWGSAYSAYNRWRAWLSQTMLNADPREVWRNEAKYSGAPFYELINFSDCEGIIGPVVAKKLAADFASHQWKADHFGQDENGWYARKYADWRKAFELAADDGFILFH
jgi:hypothetical protein